MKKRIVIFAALSAVGLYGVGFLAANHWRVPPALTEAFLPAALQPDAQAGAIPDWAAGALPPPTGAGSVADVQPGDDPHLASMQYRNIRDLGTLPPDEVARIYDLDGLPHADGHLVMNQRTRVIVENLLTTLPRAEILRSKTRLEEAVSLNFGKQVAAEFAGLLVEYVNYMDTVEALSNERNARGITAADVPDNDAVRQRLQNEAFGKDKAASLFLVERETRALMAKHASDINGSAAAPSPEQIERMKAEYLAILNRDVPAQANGRTQ